MPMELRKRKTPPPPPPPRQKRTKSTASISTTEKKAPAASTAKKVKDAVVSKGEEVVKAVVDATATATTTTTTTEDTKPAAKNSKQTKEKPAPKKSAAAEKKEAAAAAAAEKKAAAAEKKEAAAAAAAEKKEAAAAAAAEKKEAAAAEKNKEEKQDDAAPAAAEPAAPVEEKKAESVKPEVADQKKVELKVGDAIPTELSAVKTDDGEETTIHSLLEKSDKGIIVFAYPAANTPGCTKQACHFRDTLPAFTTSGYSIYGLSGDSPKKNKSFSEKQKLGYQLLCDEGYSLHEAFGIKKSGAKPGTVRSVFALEKESGKVVLLEKGSPDGTWEAAKKFAGVE